MSITGPCHQRLRPYWDRDPSAASDVHYHLRTRVAVAVAVVGGAREVRVARDLPFGPPNQRWEFVRRETGSETAATDRTCYVPAV